MIKAIFLDMDETLCDTKLADRKTQTWIKDFLLPEYKIKNSNKWSERYFLGVYKKLNNEFPDINRFHNDEESFRIALIESLFNEQNIFLDKKEYKKIQFLIDKNRMKEFDFFPGVGSLLKNLRKTYTLIIITNGPTFSQHPKLQRVNLSEYVDHIIVGGEEPEEKPSPSIFQKALALAQAEASQAIHVGDSLTTDVIGANKIGITSVWISPKNEITNSMTFTPDYVIPCVTELPYILNHLMAHHG
jgi:HAD superfamily hydrolase (TIGR01549 family)